MRYALLLLLLLPAPACKDRPVECQRLRQCCDRARALGDTEDVRVACTRKDDSDAVLCRRRLEEVQRMVPQVATEEACASPP